VAADSEPRQLTSMCVVSDTTVAVGDRFGGIAILGVPEDMARGAPWRRSVAPDRGIAQRPACLLVKLAALSVGDAVTSLMLSKYSRGLFFTTLMGQIGCFVPLESESEFAMLADAELLTERLCAQEFGLTCLRQFGSVRLNVVSADVLDLIDRLSPAAQRARAISDGISDAATCVSCPT